MKASSQGRIEKNGWLIAYSLFEQGGKRFLALFKGHRMTNDRYYEIDMDGNVVFRWADCDFEMVGDDDFNRQVRQERADADARMEAAGLII